MSMNSSHKMKKCNIGPEAGEREDGSPERFHSHNITYRKAENKWALKVMADTAKDSHSSPAGERRRGPGK